jgi:hypothetical protein
MDENKTTTEEETIVTPSEDLEAKVTALEAEKAKLIEESANYKVAYLKEKQKKENFNDEESEDDRMRRVASEVLTNSRLAEIAREQDAIIQKALKENKELKLAVSNKVTPPSSTGASNETTKVVKDTLITDEQMKAFQARGWTEKDIERYKKNLQRYSGR